LTPTPAETTVTAEVELAGTMGAAAKLEREAVAATLPAFRLVPNVKALPVALCTTYVVPTDTGQLVQPATEVKEKVKPTTGLKPAMVMVGGVVVVVAVTVPDEAGVAVAPDA